MLQEYVQVIAGQIKANRCVIILGPNVVKISEDEVLQDALWEKVANNPSLNIEQDADQLLLFPNEMERMKYLAQMQEFYDTHKKPDDLYTKLAQLPAPVMLSVSPDVRLYQAFKDQNFNCQYGFYNKVLPNPQEFTSPNKDNPIVYNLFGSIVEQDSLIMTQNDLMDYLFDILGDRKLPPSLMYPIKKAKFFLFLGFDFDKWYLRLILRLFGLHENCASLASGYSERTMKPTQSFYNESFGVVFVQEEEVDYINALHKIFKDEKALRTPTDANTSSIKQKIRDLISKDELKVAIEELQDYADEQGEESLINQSLVLSGRLSKMEREKLKGVLSSEQSNLERNRIRDSFIEIVNQL